MKKKILVTVRQFKSAIGKLDVDSRLFDGDSKEPITLKDKDPQGNEYNYHLGQISSSLLWAVQDIPDQDRTAKKEMNKMFPQGYEFEFYYMPVKFCSEESKKWWNEISEDYKKELIIQEGERIYGPLDEEEKEQFRRKQIPRMPLHEIENLWTKNAMIHSAVKLQPVDLNNVIF